MECFTGTIGNISNTDNANLFSSYYAGPLTEGFNTNQTKDHCNKTVYKYRNKPWTRDWVYNCKNPNKNFTIHLDRYNSTRYALYKDASTGRFVFLTYL